MGSARAQAASDCHSASGAQVCDLPLSGGARQRVLYQGPAAPRASIVMLPGGAGDVGIGEDGSIKHGHNFVIRTAPLWQARGFAVVIPDALDGENLRGSRSSADYGHIVEDLVGFAHSRSPGPVFLLGTSQGSIAAMNGASQLHGTAIAGVVLTEAVSREGGSHESVFDAHPDGVTVPALIVANRDDACPVAPPEDAPKVAAALTHARDVKVLTVAGGTAGAKPCGSLSPHGYQNIEDKVVDAIATWMGQHL